VKGEGRKKKEDCGRKKEDCGRRREKG